MQGPNSLVLPGNFGTQGIWRVHCTLLSDLLQMQASCVEAPTAFNAFEKCYKLATPWWLHYWE